MEKGIITLIGATTENPSFTVINALLSRCRTYILEPIQEAEIVEFLEKNMEKIGERYPSIVIARSESVPVTNDVAIQVSETVETGLLRSSQ